ncbi:UDP-N-acetylglucosamine pyrophosphorylase [Tieghemiomyces parasiticus]|uniref:UDP-N-acetylglucosamine diphosphorylase n=1 Tax=Tieghemiomyces parasiticus TaxID=78921 RepID=A0A9W8DRI0_9FUNG|nr:UDP-N-acetylglucosamine pyrophosphorylase [Tieghemiomyces parasiticus]
MMTTQSQIPQAQAVREKFAAAGQEQVFAYWDELTSAEQAGLLEQAQALDVDYINKIAKQALDSLSVSQETAHRIEPLPEGSVGSTLTASAEQQQAWFQQGLELIAQGQVAVILMAGGQGTRLGSSQPKGCYDINLLSHSSLFRLQAERIVRLQNLAAQTFPQHAATAVIPWAIMTSGPTRANTEAHFEAHRYFGLDSRNVIFFNQGTLPCLSFDGKILLESKGKVSEAPDGNGGIYAALHRHHVISDLRRRGVRYVHSYCVDNCLVRVADPVFIAYCVAKGAECGAKVVPKSSWDEAVGVICHKNGRFAVVEYSEISSEMAQLTRADNGRLAYNAGNIANHFYTLDFLDRVPTITDGLEHHVAKKKIKHVDPTTGQQVAPAKPNGIKLEQFVFDVFPYTDNLAVFEVERREEFSPLKNAPGTGSDDPETSRRDLAEQHLRFAQAVGATVVKGPEDPAPQGEISFELSPIVTYAGEGLEFLQGRTLTTPQLITKPL